MPTATGPATGSRGSVVVVAVWAVAAALLTAIRAMPNMGSPTAGCSVAERMAAGDRLYVDVWDNKDPVFYYLMAAGRVVTPLADYALEIGWLVVVAVAVYALARDVVDSALPAVVAAATGLLAVTGGAYIAGYTYLPGTALVLVAAALSARGRLGLLGSVLAVLVFAKPMMAPLAVVAVAAWWIGARRRDLGRGLGRVALGFAPVAAGFLALLAARGEASRMGGRAGRQRRLLPAAVARQRPEPRRRPPLPRHRSPRDPRPRTRRRGRRRSAVVGPARRLESYEAGPIPRGGDTRDRCGRRARHRRHRARALAQPACCNRRSHSPAR